MNLNSEMVKHYDAQDWSRIFLSLSIIPHVNNWLDCGAGDGSITSLIDKVVGKAIALEIDINQLNNLKNLINKKQISGYACPGDITNIKYADEQFDGLSAFEIIEHLTDEQLELAVKEMKRVVKKGGCIVLSTPIKNAIQDPDHKQSFDSGKLLSMFPDAEFHQERIERDEGRACLWYIIRWYKN